jgi:hypothetical protein
MMRSPPSPQSIAELIDRFGGPAKFASTLNEVDPSLDLKRGTATEMKRRSRIAVDYWPAIIEAAKRAGIAKITPDLLMNLNTAGENVGAVEEEGAAQ